MKESREYKGIVSLEITFEIFLERNFVWLFFEVRYVIVGNFRG